MAISTISSAEVLAVTNERPNFVFILTDDQGYGDIGAHGHPLLKTPHLDRLHAESVRFENFYVSPSCSPTRAALLTGRHEFRSGVTHTIKGRVNLSKQALTLPQLLKEAGYRTGFVGKWHLGNEKGYRPSERGFDWTSTNAGGGRVHFDPTIIRNGKRNARTGFREDLFFEEAMSFMEEAGEDPFFCYLATFSPHAPLAAPPEYLVPFEKKVDEKQAAYLGMIANIDYNVGRLMAFLEKRELAKNTVVVFMNDNGITEGLDIYNAGMRGCKSTIWEGGSRAMSFWRWPKQWSPHQVDNLAAHLDFLPTICDLAAVEIEEPLRSKLEGFSLVPLLESKGPLTWNEDRILFQHVARWPVGLAASHKYAMAGVRKGNHLLVQSQPCENPACKEHSGPCNILRAVEKGALKANYTKKNAQYHWGISKAEGWALYEVKQDPACEDDLSSEKPALVKELSAAYEKWWEDIFPEMIQAGGDSVILSN